MLLLVFIAIAVPVALLATELIPVLRPATTVDRGRRRSVEPDSDAIPAYEDRAIEALQRANSERTRSLIDALVTAIAELRQSWAVSPERADWVEDLDRIALRAFDSVDALMEAEEVVAGVSPLDRTARHEAAHRRIVRTGSALVRLASDLRELKRSENPEASDASEALGGIGTVLDFDVADEAGEDDEELAKEEAELALA